MKQLDAYNQAEQEIYEYFGYEPSWTVYPIDDCRDSFWVVEIGDDDDTLTYADSIHELQTGTGNCYRDEIRGKVYRGPEFTAIEVDTHCDGNRFLRIFDNTKEVKDGLDSTTSDGED